MSAAHLWDTGLPLLRSPHCLLQSPAQPGSELPHSSSTPFSILLPAQTGQLEDSLFIVRPGLYPPSIPDDTQALTSSDTWGESRNRFQVDLGCFLEEAGCLLTFYIDNDNDNNNNNIGSNAAERLRNTCYVLNTALSTVRAGAQLNLPISLQKDIVLQRFVDTELGEKQAE